MNRSGSHIRFWCLLVLQAIGSQVLIWIGLPVYRRHIASGREGASPEQFVVVMAAIVTMQASYWAAFRLQPRLRFRRNLVLGHLLAYIGELSLFFGAAMATVIAFNRYRELQFVLWKVLVLATCLFAICCYK